MTLRQIKSFLFALSFLLCLGNSLSAKVWINEFMQSNIDCLRDDLQEFPDSWVELYNDSNQPVSLQGWSIGLGSKASKAWKLKSDVTIPAKGYQLIYCDQEDKGLHADFRLESGGSGTIHLFDANGELIDRAINIPKQPAPNVARGRVTDGGTDWIYFITATPGKNNQIYPDNTSRTVAPDPTFSLAGGVFRDKQSLTIYAPAGLPEGAEIRYTIDGTEPTEESRVFRQRILITESVTIRAKVFAPGYLINRSVVQSYIITDREFTLPLVSLTIDPEYLFDEDFGIYVRGSGKYGEAGKCAEGIVNWNKDWRRPMNIEYYPVVEDESVINQLGELRVGGGCTRIYPQKTFIVYANKRFGENKRFDYPIFSEQQEIKSFMLRNSGNDVLETHFKDAAIQLLMGGKVDVDYQRFQPAITYVNGEYWGIFNLRERSTDDYVLANYGIEDIDMLENWTELKAGDTQAWDNLMAIIEADSRISFEEMAAYIDIDEYINYMILEIYTGNVDFPFNNTVCWRPRTKDGKWRFILKDLDYGLLPGFWKTDFFEYNLVGEGTPRKIFSYLMAYPEFAERFSNRFAVYLGDLFQKQHVYHVVDSIKEILVPEIAYHHQRWYKISLETWSSYVDEMKTWTDYRNPIVYKQLEAHFDLGRSVPLSVQVPSWFPDYTLSLNGVDLYTGSFDGCGFAGSELRISGSDATGYIQGWEVTEFAGEHSKVTLHPDASITYTVTDCDSIAIRAYLYPTPIDERTLEVKVSTTDDNTLQISGMDSGSEIALYDLKGILIHQIDNPGHSVALQLTAPGIYLLRVQTPAGVFTQKVIVP